MHYIGQNIYYTNSGNDPQMVVTTLVHVVNSKCNKYVVTFHPLDIKFDSAVIRQDEGLRMRRAQRSENVVSNTGAMVRKETSSKSLPSLLVVIAAIFIGFFLGKFVLQDKCVCSAQLLPVSSGPEGRSVCSCRSASHQCQFGLRRRGKMRLCTESFKQALPFCNLTRLVHIHTQKREKSLIFFPHFLFFFFSLVYVVVVRGSFFSVQGWDRFNCTFINTSLAVKLPALCRDLYDNEKKIYNE